MAIPVYVGGVAEISTTTGTGAYTLGGAVPGYTSFADRVSHGATVHYRVTDGSRTEIVRGVFDASANTLSRDVIAEPSSGAVSWGVGRRIIYLDFGDSITSYVSVRAIAGLSPVAISGSAVDLPDLATIATTGSASDLETGTVPLARLPSFGTTFLSDVLIDSNLLDGQLLVRQGEDWINQSPTIAMMFDVRLDSNFIPGNLLFWDGTDWANRTATASDIDDFDDASFWEIADTASAIDEGDLNDEVFLAAVDEGDIAGAGDTDDAAFIAGDDGEF